MQDRTLFLPCIYCAQLSLVGSGGGVVDKEPWSPKMVETVWGITQDVVTLPNGNSYYFFKIPHKVT